MYPCCHRSVDRRCRRKRAHHEGREGHEDYFGLEANTGAAGRERAEENEKEKEKEKEEEWVFERE